MCSLSSLISMGIARCSAGHRQKRIRLTSGAARVRQRARERRRMGWDACSASSSAAMSSSSSTSSPSASSGGKRSRDPEEEVYLDNFHSQKRYLSEIMASSLNGLTVGDSLGDNLMESPSRSETICTPRDEITLQYSPMSEDLDDTRFCDSPLNTSLVQSDSVSTPTSPVSPYRHQRPINGFSSVSSYPLPGCTLAAVVCSHARHRRSDSEGRFPSSPNDVCHTADLRRAALLRSVQMRAQPYFPPAYELPFLSGQEDMHHAVEEEGRACSYIKTLDDETDYQSLEQVADYGEVCSSAEDNSEAKLGQGD